MQQHASSDPIPHSNDNRRADQGVASGQLPNRLLTVFEVAEFVGCHQESVRREYTCGQLRRQGFPLPADVGAAMAAYLRDRGLSQTRRVFLCMRAPGRSFAGPGAVTTIVRRARGRADLHPPVRGAHLLRHSLATHMLRHGASLAEIGQVLRHRMASTTEIYAKVDLESLRTVVQPVA
jgi:site-specific recombinase XerD